MYLYKIEVELSDKRIFVVMIAETEEEAFEHTEIYLDKEYISNSNVKGIYIMQKKRISSGQGYVIGIED